MFLKIRPMAFAAVLVAAVTVEARAQDPVADFYRGKTVNGLIGTVVGGEYDLHTRMVLRFIGKHIPGNPTVVAQNMVGGGGIVMANYLYAVPPKDGTYLGVINNAYPLAQALGEETIKFDAARFFWLGTLAPTIETMAVWRTTGVKSIEDARRTEVVIGATGKGTITYTFPRMLNELLGTRFKIVAGSALAVGAATAVTGAIGFIGLIVPHVLRPYVADSPGRLLLPSLFGGATLVLISDVALRVLEPKGDLRLGVLSALIGAPFFLWLVVKKRRELQP